MKNRTQIWKILAFLGAVLFLSDTIYAQQWTSDSHSEYKRDTLPFSQRFIHRLGVEGRAGYIFQTNPFLEYSNHQYKPMKKCLCRPSEILLPAPSPHRCRPGLYRSLSRDWSRLFQLRQSGRAGQPAGGLSVSRGTHRPIQPPHILEL